MANRLVRQRRTRLFSAFLVSTLLAMALMPNDLVPWTSGDVQAALDTQVTFASAA